MNAKAAVMHGRKEPANPGPRGDPRWKYTHSGVVYLTDETSRHEIASWRIDGIGDTPGAECAPGAHGVHAVLIVDSSGSMRKDDVPGYTTRTQAVYDCLSRDFVDSQIASGANDIVVTLIEMNDSATVVFSKQPLEAALSRTLRSRGSNYARSHGNYLPVLHKALEIMRADAANSAGFLLLFLSDGAPSDHTEKACQHGIKVWQPDSCGRLTQRGKPLLVNCPYGRNTCRNTLHETVRRECVGLIQSMGDVLGRDRTMVSTVAFGNPNENFNVLQEMGEVLPRGSFSKLGVNPAALRTALSALSSSLTTLTTEGGSRSMTLRSVRVRRGQKDDQDTHVQVSSK